MCRGWRLGRCSVIVFFANIKTLLSFSYSYRLTVLWGVDGNRARAGANMTAPIQHWRSHIIMVVRGSQAGIKKMPRSRECVTPHRWSASTSDAPEGG